MSRTNNEFFDDSSLESTYRNYHPTYSRKPKPLLQLQSEMSCFETDGTATFEYNATVHDAVPLEIPSQPDAIYDPSHPESDWTGLISLKNAQKRHVRNHISQRCNLNQTEYGICGEGDNDILRKKTSNNFAASNSVTKSRKDPYENMPMIGGISDNDSQYKTTYSRLVNQEKTHSDQLTLEKRSLPRKMGNESVDDGRQRYKNRMESLQQQSLNGNIMGNPETGNNFYKPQQSYMHRSLMAGLGSSLVNKVPERPMR
jgi:flagellar basal body rod protein FlgC